MDAIFGNSTTFLFDADEHDLSEQTIVSMAAMPQQD